MGYSSATVASLSKKLRKLVGASLSEEDSIIGGPDIVVEIDESKLNKNKYHRGNLVNRAWVLGGVERIPERKLFLVEVPYRRAETFINIILRHVRPGSVIMTECFRSYNSLYQTYEHLQVNHSREFFNPQNGACTNTIEGTRNGLKCKISPRNRTNSYDENGEIKEYTLDYFLCEFKWRRNHENDM